MESVEVLANRWQLTYQTLESGTRRQIVGSLLEADPAQSLSLSEAVRILFAVDPSTEMSEHLIDGWHFHDNSSVIS